MLYMRYNNLFMKYYYRYSYNIYYMLYIGYICNTRIYL